jgi:hypothetical protein
MTNKVNENPVNPNILFSSEKAGIQSGEQVGIEASGETHLVQSRVQDRRSMRIETNTESE